jgi:hypothetical protein
MLMRSRHLFAAVVVALGLAACQDLTAPPPGRGKPKVPGKGPSAQVQHVQAAPLANSSAGSLPSA